MYIIINEYNNFLWLCYKEYIVFPAWLAVNHRNFRYGNAANVCRYSKQMETFLRLEGIKFQVTK